MSRSEIFRGFYFSLIIFIPISSLPFSSLVDVKRVTVDFAVTSLFLRQTPSSPTQVCFIMHIDWQKYFVRQLWPELIPHYQARIQSLPFSQLYKCCVNVLSVEPVIIFYLLSYFLSLVLFFSFILKCTCSSKLRECFPKIKYAKKKLIMPQLKC